MESNLKARIIGAVVTVLALALVLPNILQSGHFSREITSNMPVKPATPEWVDEKQGSRVRIELNSLASGAFKQKITAPDPRYVLQDEAKVLHIAGERGGLDEKGAAVAWTLQLGAFKQSKNAIELRDGLRTKGYKAYILKSGAGTYDRVYVGPMLQRSKAERLRVELIKQTDIKDIRLRQYKPE
jgi:DedD protein